MTDFSTFSDQQLMAYIKQNQQPINGTTQQVPVEASSSQAPTSDQKLFTESAFQPTPTLISAAHSKISLSERMWYGMLADEHGKERMLKEKYRVVYPDGQGKYLVGDTPQELHSIDIDGLTEEGALASISNMVGMIPSVAGQILGAIGGTALAGPGGGVVGAGAGAAIGEGARIELGKALGVNQESVEDETTDIVLSGAFGSLGEGLGLAAKAVGSNVIAPRIAKALDMAVETHLEPPKAIKFLAKVFNITANVPEQSTIDLFETGGFQKGFTKENLDKRTIIPLVNRLSTALNETREELGAEVGKQTTRLLKAVKILDDPKLKRVDVGDLYAHLRQRLINEKLIDDVTFKINPNIKGALSQDATTLLGLLSELGSLDATVPMMRRTFSAIPNIKTLTPEAMWQITNAFSKKFSNISAEGQGMVKEVLRGGQTGEGKILLGLKDRLNLVAKKVGLEDFVTANNRYSNFMNLRGRLTHVGLDTSYPSNVESFMKSLERMGEFTMDDIKALQAHTTDVHLLNDWRRWNAAQDFTGSRLNMLRLGAVAGLAGFSIGGGDFVKRIQRLGLGFLLGTPGGLRFTLSTGERVLGPAIAAGRQSAVMVAHQTLRSPTGIPTRMGTAVLSQLLKSSRTPTARKGTVNHEK